MVAINKLRVHSKATEIDTLSGRIIAGYENSGIADDNYLVMLFGELKPLSASLTTAVKRGRAESVLEEKDDIRDGKVRALNYFILGSKYNPEEQVSAAAEKAGKVFDNYGMGIINESYAVESSLIESLLEDLAKPELQSSLEALPGINLLINDIKVAQAEFEAASLSYEKEKSEESKLESATKIKKKVVSVINDKLVNYLTGICLSNEEKYGEFARTVAQLIDDNNLAVKKRSGKKETTAQ